MLGGRGCSVVLMIIVGCSGCSMVVGSGWGANSVVVGGRSGAEGTVGSTKGVSVRVRVTRIVVISGMKVLVRVFTGGCSAVCGGLDNSGIPVTVGATVKVLNGKVVAICPFPSTGS